MSSLEAQKTKQELIGSNLAHVLLCLEDSEREVADFINANGPTVKAIRAAKASLQKAMKAFAWVTK